MQFLNLNSSAVENIEVQNEQVMITFTGGRQYTYNTENLETFVSKLSETISKGDSVGKLINNSIQSKELTVV